MKKLLSVLLIFGLSFTAQAHSYRVFYLLRENGEIHGDHMFDDGTWHPYHYTANAPSKEAARRELLREVPNAVEIQINDLNWD